MPNWPFSSSKHRRGTRCTVHGVPYTVWDRCFPCLNCIIVRLIDFSKGPFSSGLQGEGATNKPIAHPIDHLHLSCVRHTRIYSGSTGICQFCNNERMKLDTILNDQYRYYLEGDWSHTGYTVVMLIFSYLGRLFNFTDLYHVVWQWSCYLLLCSMLSDKKRPWQSDYSILVGLRHFLRVKD